MDGIHRRFTQRKLSQRRFLHPIYSHFTQRSDGTTWSKANNTLRTAPRYLEGVLLPGRRKTMRSIARRVNVPEDRIQRFITESPWTHEGVQIQFNKHIPPEIASPKACLFVDEVGLLKQGHKSVGVQKQYIGAAGRVENSQVAVDLVLATPGDSESSHHTWPLGFQLFMPEAWGPRRIRVSMTVMKSQKTCSEVQRVNSRKTSKTGTPSLMLSVQKGH